MCSGSQSPGFSFVSFLSVTDHLAGVTSFGYGDRSIRARFLLTMWTWDSESALNFNSRMGLCFRSGLTPPMHVNDIQGCTPLKRFSGRCPCSKFACLAAGLLPGTSDAGGQRSRRDDRLSSSCCLAAVNCAGPIMHRWEEREHKIQHESDEAANKRRKRTAKIAGDEKRSRGRRRSGDDQSRTACAICTLLSRPVKKSSEGRDRK